MYDFGSGLLVSTYIGSMAVSEGVTPLSRIIVEQKEKKVDLDGWYLENDVYGCYGISIPGYYWTSL